MARTAFEDLKVYRLAEQLADIVWDVVLVWERLAKDTVGKQLVRAADSIGANLAEGVGRGSFQDNRRFIRIARGSLNETKHWLRRAYRRNLVGKTEVEIIRPLLDELAPRLNAYLKSIGPREEQQQRTTDN
jgi:four helix bundle protein